MRTEMRNQSQGMLQESMNMALRASRDYGNKLIEKWDKRKDIVGDNFAANVTKSNEFRMRNTAILLENLENHLNCLTETQISSTFGTSPQNVMRVMMLGYPNSVRGEIFHEWSMKTMHDSLWYVKSVYGSTKRDATANAVTYESTSYRYPNGEIIDTVGNGSTTNYTTTFSETPIYPYKVTVYVNGVPCASDDGAGNIAGAIPAAVLAGGITISGTVTYTPTASYNITFSSAPNLPITIGAFEDMEVAANYDDLGTLQLIPTNFQFYPVAKSLGISISKSAELLFGTTLNVGADEALVKRGAEELKKTLDFRTLKLGYQVSKKNTAITFDADWRTGGAASKKLHMQGFTATVRNAGSAIYNQYLRGGVSKIYAGTSMINDVMSLNDSWVDDNTQAKIGAFKVGTIMGIDVYQAPSDILPTNEAVAVYNNSQGDEFDAAISCGVLLAGSTPPLEFSTMKTEHAIYNYEDTQVLNPGYIRRIVANNIV